MIEAVIKGEIARFIVSAPDMLEALEGAKWAMESYICAQLLEKMDEYQDVVKAIQKARSIDAYD